MRPPRTPTLPSKRGLPDPSIMLPPRTRRSSMASLPALERSLPRRALALLLVGLTAIALRFWRLSWGLDHGLCFPDEQLLWGVSAARFVPLTWDSFGVEELPYPTLYGYLAGLATALAHSLGLLQTAPPSQLEGVWIARLVSAAAGVGTSLAVGALAWRAYGPGSGSRPPRSGQPSRSRSCRCTTPRWTSCSRSPARSPCSRASSWRAAAGCSTRHSPARRRGSRSRRSTRAW